MYFDNKKDFQIQQSWDNPQKTPNKPPKSTKDVPVKLDQQISNIVLRDLQMLPKAKDNTNDAVEQLINQHKMRQQSPIRQPSPKLTKDLNQSLASRLAQTEKLCHSQRLELREKSGQITELRDQIKELQKFGNCNQDTYILNIKNENQQLKSQIIEMEKFLNKYGVKWVGNKPDDGAHEKMQQMVKDIGQPKPYFNYHLPKEISIEVIQKRIQELNYIVEKEGANQIVKNANGMHQFQKMEPLPIGFYSNGIAMKGFKFFAYGSNDSYQILADVLDGYFPYQLKTKYPNGILLKVIDKTEEMYDSTKTNNTDILSVDERQLKPQSKDEFLDKMPKNIIRNGKVIPIRSELEKIFCPGNQDDQRLLKLGCRKDPIEGNWIVGTQAQQQLDLGQDIDNVCTLKFRTETGKFTLIALMYSDSTIQDMYEAVHGLREFPDKKFEILLNFPRTVFTSEDKTTLEDAGLVPSAQLFFKSAG